jgi:glycolate oxidase
MQMPVPDAAVIARRADIAAALAAIVPDGVIADDAGVSPYGSDGLTMYRQSPLAVVLPRTTAQVSAVLAWCHANRVKVVARGSGTSLSGGALPLADGIVLAMSRFNRILGVDFEDRVAVVQPGVTNLAVSHAVAPRGFYYAPDPSSQIACSIGGNVAENAGGVHCLKYGTTSPNLLGVELVLIDGTVLRLGGAGMEQQGLDLLGLVCGSEGLLAVVTEATLRILPRPATARALLLGFPTVADASNCVAAIIAAGIIPAGLEMMDAPAIRAAEDFVKAGYPIDAAALMIAEADGHPALVDEQIARITAIAGAHNVCHLAESRDEAQRLLFWAGRKAAFPAVGRIASDYYCVDGTIPRRALASVLAEISAIAARHGLAVANVFHAGDGNLHPLVMYDASIPGQTVAAEHAGAEILKACVDAGGVLTGEHGVGVEKLDLMPHQFSAIDLAVQSRLKCAFDAGGLLNPGKLFPTLARCAETNAMHVHAGRLPFPDLPRF